MPRADAPGPPIAVPPRGTRGRTARHGRALRIAVAAAAWLHRRKHDRVLGLDVLYLTTVGARTGKERTVPLAWFPDPVAGWLVIASYGGAVQHPAWFLNMAANPDRIRVEVGGRRVRASAQALAGAERAERFAAIAAAHPRYATYAARTDREIPVVRLREVAAGR